MGTLSITAKGQVTLKRDLLQHMGLAPGQKVAFDKLPNGEIRMRAAQAEGSIENFIGRHAGKIKKPLSLEEINEIAASGWTGRE